METSEQQQLFIVLIAIVIIIFIWAAVDKKMTNQTSNNLTCA